MSTNGDRKCEGEHIHPRTKVTLNDLAKHGIHRPTHTSDKKSVAKNVVIGASIVGGTASTTVGVIAAGTSATGAISAAGAAIGGLAGGVFGSGVGLAAGGVGCEGEHIHPRTKVTLNDLAKHGIHRLTHTSDKKSVAKNVVIGASIVGGTAATTVGVIAAGTSATGAISAAGAAIGGLAGGVFGSGVGLAAGGVGMAATVPFAAAGAAIGGWAGPALALVGIGTAPAWAVPVAIGGVVVAIGGAATAISNYSKSRVQKEKA